MKTEAGKVVDATFEVIGETLNKSEEVRLTGFGTFSTSERKAGKGRNPRTGEEIAIPASTTVRFKAGKQLKDSVGEAARAAAAKAKPAKKPAAAKSKGA